MTDPQQITRVVQIHTLYRQPGGEDRVVEDERRLLEDAGVSVEQVIFDNADLRESGSVLGDLSLAASAIWSRSAKYRVAMAIRRHRPQVVHVHNTFPAASPSVYPAAVELGVPVVQTLHNYRFICPVATLFREGHVCRDCVGRAVPWPAVVHACIHDSHARSAVGAATLTVHRAVGTFDRGIACYVALSSFQRHELIAGGLPADRIRVIPNFLDTDPGVGGGERSGIVFVGRLSKEKGIDVLVEAAGSTPGIMRMAGAGPLSDLVERAHASGDIEYVGRLASDAVLDELKSATAMVLPSVCFEGFPLTIVEAFACGTPVIASRIGSLEDLIEDGLTGLLTAPGDPDDLASKMRWAADHPAEMRAMGANARARYETLYRGPEHLRALLDAYRFAASSRPVRFAP